MENSKKRVLVTGAKGMLGHKVIENPPASWVVKGVDIDDFDITSLDDTLAFVGEFSPDLLINCAAMTDVDVCESRFVEAYKINGIGAGNLARASSEAGAEIVHVSTDYVFDGEKREPYREDDPVCITSAYGRSKLAGEQWVGRNNQKHWIVRTQWLYGPGGKNFVDTIIRVAGEKESLDVVNDQTGCPTYAPDLASELVRIASMRPPYGIYHCSNNGSASWFDFARVILDKAGLTHVKVNPITSDKLDRPAKRPAHSILDNFHLRHTIGDRMRGWEEALEDYIGPRKT